MAEKELFEKNQKLSTEFDLYLLDHPELLDKIPQNALIVLLPEFDQELKEKNLEMAGLSFPEGYGEVSSLDAGSQVVPWLLVRVVSPFYGLDLDNCIMTLL
ncbi:hypothetical protein HKBW3S43_01701 [Candidatus Hakubella thermalkaliphila]|uniref:Uncharacterized protein n=1 Tax=Candidatus Hakubella thermalkaliphila TaxID=2754717 RepID=A0A6V8PVN6_9ACTN|nr:DUF5647 family protein [Candidatus Hakubella thermalkaliphila]GFP27463.1 hypothetical protein HKBW3S33_00876 [Candidatus Hakubella thermalkaliphila]GFP35914.1 hypothetical protein HKBW3S43_01701 [Candidatus Hakubella thermalkaliphila]